MTALDKLIEAVEAGPVGVDECAAAFPSESAYGVCTWHHAWDALNGSLDAALALHEALLPEWHWSMDDGGGQEGAFCCVSHPSIDKVYDADEATTPARAWLLAILRAYRSVQV